MSAARGLQRIGTFIQAWFLGSGTGRRRSDRSRWLHAGLAAILLVAGVAAWALALVQPWKAQASDPGIVAVPGRPAPQQVQAAVQEAEHLLEPQRPPAPPALGRNPFTTPGWVGTPNDPPGPRPGTGGRAALPGAGPMTAKEAAETLRGLHLKATVHSRGGEQWAVINEKAYREGDAVAGLVLVEIGDDRATLRRDGVTCVLRMD